MYKLVVKILFTVLTINFVPPSFAADPLYYGTGSDVLKWISKEFKRTESGKSSSGHIATRANGEHCEMSYVEIARGITRFLISDLKNQEVISIDISPSEKVRYYFIEAGAQSYATVYFPNNASGVDQIFFEFDDPSYYFRITMKRGNTKVSCFFDG